MKREAIKWLALLFAVGLIIAPLNAQNDREDRYVFTLRSASGALTAGETSSSVWTAPHIDIVVILRVTTITTADGDDEVDFYFQTAHDDNSGSPAWTDLENIHFDNADNGTTATRVVRLGPWAPISTADKGAAVSDGALADDTKLAYPVGWMIRIKTTVTGATAPTYAYSAEVFLR
jgi:hypothetical protein